MPASWTSKPTRRPREPGIPTSEQLLAAPELAVLHALEAALAVSTRALLAAHPEIEEEDLAGSAPLVLAPAGWIAESALRLIDALEQSIQRYRTEVTRAHARGRVDPYPF